MITFVLLSTFTLLYQIPLYFMYNLLNLVLLNSVDLVLILKYIHNQILLYFYRSVF